MEHHLQQQVAEFLAQVGKITTVDGVGDLVGFLDGVGQDAVEILLQVPRAAAFRIAQARHDGEQALDAVGGARQVHGAGEIRGRAGLAPLPGVARAACGLPGRAHARPPVAARNAGASLSCQPARGSATARNGPLSRVSRWL